MRYHGALFAGLEGKCAGRDYLFPGTKIGHKKSDFLPEIAAKLPAFKK